MQENILNNFVPGTLAHLVGPVPANILSFAIRLGYCVCLMVRPEVPIFFVAAMGSWRYWVGVGGARQDLKCRSSLQGPA